MSNNRYPVLRILLSLLFLGWGIVQIVFFALLLPDFTLASAIYLFTGIILLPIGALGLIHKAVPVCRLMCVILFLLTALAFLVTIVIHLFTTEIAVSFGSLFTALLAAIELSLL